MVLNVTEYWIHWGSFKILGERKSNWGFALLNFAIWY